MTQRRLRESRRGRGGRMRMGGARLVRRLSVWLAPFRCHNDSLNRVIFSLFLIQRPRFEPNCLRR